ncbi:MAG: hypothetical protein OJF52_000501 [Nitrospira sp.]|jgi:hypothetical protein|nr:MAG: hypothetical protein OJF52_000501 [Nitrospira sp.]
MVWAHKSRSGAVPCEEVKMNVWHDMWPEISVLLFLMFMAGLLVLTFVFTR